MRTLIRVGLSAAVVFVGASNTYASTPSTPSATNISVATYYNAGSGFVGVYSGASPSSGNIIRLSAFYRDANGNVYELGTGSATATITFTVNGHNFPIGSTAACACRSVQFSPGIPVTSVSYSGVTLGTAGAYTLVMTVAQPFDPNGTITAAYQYGSSTSPTEQNEIAFTTAQTINFVGVRLVSYSNSTAQSDFLPWTAGGTNDSRTVTFKVTGDSNTYTATLSSSTGHQVIQMKQTDSIAAYVVAITWSQNNPGDEMTYVWFYPSATAIQ